MTVGETQPVVDLHCHVLPGLDDGPETVVQAIALARDAREDGTATIAATPHVDWAYPTIDAARIGAAVRALQGQLDAAGVDVSVVPGAEVSATRAVALDDAELRELTLGGGPWLLLECPLSATMTPGFAGIVRALARRGHHLLLAHPERSPLFLRSPELLEELITEGVLAQVTAGALTGRYGRGVRELALGLVHQGTAQVVASDGHGAHRPARIAGELGEREISPELLEWLAHEVPLALLGGDPLPPRPETPPRPPRGRLLRLVGR